MDDLQYSAQKLKNKMPNKDYEKIEEKLEETRHKVAHEKLSNYEEKRLIKEIDDLEVSIPHVKPLKELNKKIADLRTIKNERGKAMNTIYQRKKEVEDEIVELKEKLGEIKNMKEQHKVE